MGFFSKSGTMDEIRRAFALKKPCEDCPFRNDDKAVELSPGRREEIMEGLLSGQDSAFHCHKTVYRAGASNFNEEGEYKPKDVAMCAGAMALAKKLGRDPQMVQIAERLGWIKEGHYDEAASEVIDPSDLNIDRRKVHLPE